MVWHCKFVYSSKDVQVQHAEGFESKSYFTKTHPKSCANSELEFVCKYNLSCKLAALKGGHNLTVS